MIGHTERVMGTVASFAVEPGALGEEDARRAIGRACQVLHEADRLFSTFKPDSALNRLRRGETSGSGLATEMLEVLELSAKAARLTEGAFDPWAMAGGVDPTGLVKGWAAQRALGVLRRSGIAAAMVNAGGDIACFGAQPWRIGVRDPGTSGRLICVAEVFAAIATSGGYERPGEIVDPRTGRPAAGLVQATVTGADLALADAFATALMVTGEDGLGLLAGEPGYSALIVTDAGRMLATPGFPITPPIAA